MKSWSFFSKYATEEEEDLLCYFLPKEEVETETLTDANCKLLSFDKKPYMAKETEKHMNGGKKKGENLKIYTYTFPLTQHLSGIYFNQLD